METIYVMEQGCYLRREGATLIVMKDREIIDRIPAEGLKKLILIGYVNLSGPLLDHLIRNRVETVFLTPTGRFRARLAIDEHRHVELRKAQYAKFGDPAVAAVAGGYIVRGKLANMAQLAAERGRDYGDPMLKSAAVRIKAMESAAAQRGANLDMLRGFEGAGSRTYFEAFGRMIRNSKFSFKGRNRRPPLDPVNALLSFIYTLLTNEVLSAIKTVGLDPFLGALHEVAHGRPSLACDLVEEYRVHLGDRLVLALINRNSLGPDDFIYRGKPPENFIDDEEMKDKRPVEMKPAIRSTFISAYEEMMNRRITYAPLGKKVSYRMLIHHQVRAFADFIEKPEGVYSPFAWDG
jgi:CRISP-associated protein Cas1